MQILLSVDPGIPVPPLLYGGIERVAHGLIVELRKRGHRVGLVAHAASTAAVDFFVGWPTQGRSTNRNNVRTLWRAVRTFRPDLVHSFSRLGYLLPFLPLRLAKVMSYQRHTGGQRNRIAARLAGRSLAFTGCSEFIATQGQRWGGRWASIPNFVDTDFYTYRPTVPADAPLVFLSRIERIKGAHTAIAIARQAGRRLILAGNRVEQGEGAAYWQTEIAPHLGRDGIEYIGPVNDTQKNELLGSAAAMVVPIEWDEPFGIVFAEALACGTPVIACARGALPEIVETGVHGFLVSSVSEGLDAVRRLPEIARQACRQRVEERFSCRVVTGQYEALYRSLVERA